MKRFLFIFLLGFLCCPGFSAAGEKFYYFEDFKTDITVNKDSSIIVEEYETLRFVGDFTYITREIPYQGEMEIESISVFDQTDGHKLNGSEIEIYDTGYSKQITVHFQAQNQSKTWLFKYEVKNVINFFDQHDELYWNVLPDDRSVVVKEVSAIVNLPQALNDYNLFEHTVYSGYYGDTEQKYNYEILDNKTIKLSSSDIAAYKNFTIVVGWPKGVVIKPSKFTVTSEPDNLLLTVDGANTNFLTPHEFWIGPEEYFYPGEHEVILKKWGHHSYQDKVFVPANQDGAIHVDLKPTWWYIVGQLLLLMFLALYIISPIFLFIWLLRRWYQISRDPPIDKKTIIPQYGSYQNDPPGVVGTLIDERADLKDITSTIVDLAIRGYIKIIETSKKNYTLKKLKNFKTDKKLLAYEKKVLEKIFSNSKLNTEVKLSSLKNTFYSKIANIRMLMYKQVLNQDYFSKNPQKVRRKYFKAAVILLIFGLVFSFAFFLGVPLVIASILLFIFGRIMPQKTVKGVKALQWAKGFKMFLHHAERFRIKKMTPDYFERCLPYAMVFGVEKKWAQQFADIYKQSPDWYEGKSLTNNFSSIYLASALSHSFTPTLKTTLTSQPNSSGTVSGFGGGGFSGGGFGGGGFSAG